MPYTATRNFRFGVAPDPGPESVTRSFRFGPYIGGHLSTSRDFRFGVTADDPESDETAFLFIGRESDSRDFLFGVIADPGPESDAIDFTFISDVVVPVVPTALPGVMLPEPVSIPHFAYPFRLRGNGSVRTVEQDTIDEIAQCVEILLLTERGTRPEVPAYGIESLPFEVEFNHAAILAQIVRWEPRAKVLLESSVDAEDELVRRLRAITSIRRQQ